MKKLNLDYILPPGEYTKIVRNRYFFYFYNRTSNRKKSNFSLRISNHGLVSSLNIRGHATDLSFTRIDGKGRIVENGKDHL